MALSLNRFDFSSGSPFHPGLVHAFVYMLCERSTAWSPFRDNIHFYETQWSLHISHKYPKIYEDSFAIKVLLESLDDFPNMFATHLMASLTWFYTCLIGFSGPETCFSCWHFLSIFSGCSVERTMHKKTGSAQCFNAYFCSIRLTQHNLAIEWSDFRVAQEKLHFYRISSNK